MKQRFELLFLWLLAIIWVLLSIIIGFGTAVIWLLIWLFTGFNIVNKWIALSGKYFEKLG